jgi:hypothetical protein
LRGQEWRRESMRRRRRLSFRSREGSRRGVVGIGGGGCIPPFPFPQPAAARLQPPLTAPPHTHTHPNPILPGRRLRLPGPASAAVRRRSAAPGAQALRRPPPRRPRRHRRRPHGPPRRRRRRHLPVAHIKAGLRAAPRASAEASVRVPTERSGPALTDVAAKGRSAWGRIP